jgi:hypothetical protein
MYLSYYNESLQSLSKIIRISEFRRHLIPVLARSVHRKAHVGEKCLTCDHLRNRLQQTDDHDDAAKTNANVRRIRFPSLPLGELEEAQRGQNVRQGTSAGRTNELEDNADVACYQ